MNDKPRSKGVTTLLSINAAAILITGVLISSAIWLNGGVDFKAVDERSDVVNSTPEEMKLLESISDSKADVSEYVETTGNDDYVSTSSHEFDNTSVKSDELWNERAITIYATPDTDICVGGDLSDLGEMYWQTSDTNVISGFYNSARSW